MQSAALLFLMLGSITSYVVCAANGTMNRINRLLIPNMILGVSKPNQSTFLSTAKVDSLFVENGDMKTYSE